jgi:hypothetical protein
VADDEFPPEASETVPLDLDEDLEDGEGVVLQQTNVGKDNMRGGGEWPDPDTPPSRAAAGGEVHRDTPAGSYKEVLDQVPSEQAASSTSPPDEDER